MSGSIWKREISLRKARQAEPEPELVVEEAAPAAAADAVEAEAAPALPAGDYGWLTEGFDPNVVPEEMPTIAPPPVTGPPPVSPAPEPVVAAPSISPPPPLLVSPAPDAGASAPAAEPVAEPEEISLPAVAVPAAPSVPFWKKELSFSRGAKAPKQPKAAKQPKGQKPEKTETTETTETTDTTVKAPAEPFWKKELSLSRSPKAPKASKASKAPKEAKPPKEPKGAKAPKEPKEKQPKGKQVPFWKRDLPGSKTQKAPKSASVTADSPPAVGKADLVGLKIGASQIAAARVSTANGTPQLLQVARAELPDGVVISGELRDVDGLARSLKELFAKNKLPKKAVRLGIANNRIGVRTFEIGGIDDPRQLANAIRFRAQETLPIPLEEAVLDWQILSERTDEESGITTRRVLLVVAYRELVDQYVAACRKAGIRLVGIDLEAFAMLRALATADESGDAPVGAQVTVNVGHHRSTFAVSAGRVCEFTRVLAWGGYSLDGAIAAALEITPAEAAPLKHALSLVATTDEPPAGVTPETLATARDAVLRELQGFARELVSSLRFYQNQPGSLGIGGLVLTGGSANLPGFAEELNRLIGVPVSVGDPLNRVVVPKKFRTPDTYSIGSLTVAIGLGIDD
jgi:type IV pilus assembly protein PilM